jgi:protein involved in polysaccharide export with SLBB domain
MHAVGTHETAKPSAGGPAVSRLVRVVCVLPLVAIAALTTGCSTFGRPQRSTTQQVMLDANCQGDPSKMPAKELSKITLPPYVIEPPDILLIDALRVVPKPPFRIQSFDTLQVIVEGTLLEQPINGLYVVEPGGMLDLGPSYGKVMVGGQSLEEARDAVFRHLKRVLREPQVSLTLAQAAGQQQISGEHLVGPDGTINLGTYGSVYITGMTLEQAKEAIEKQLQLEGLLRYHRGGRLRRQRRPVSHHRQRDRPRRGGGDQRPLAAVEQGHLDRPAGAFRGGLRPGAPGRHRGDHEGGLDRHQLPAHAG